MEDDDSSNVKQFLVFHPPSSTEREDEDVEDQQNQRRHRSRSRSRSRKRVKSASHSPVLSKESRRCMKRQIIVLKLCSMETVQPHLTWNDLPVLKPLEPGTLDLVTITNPGNPSSFYVVFERQLDYGFNNPDWSKHFPTFETGSEALQGISCALTLHHATARQVKAKAKTDDEIPKERSFIPMELVAVKQIFKFTTPEISYQIRRGVIMGDVTGNSGTDRKFKVYLIDFGWMVMVSENLILPLPYPFQSIAPLAVCVGLYGISPCGPQWCPVSISMFEVNIAKFSREGEGEPSFHVEICSKTQGPLSPRKVVEVLLRPLKTEPSKTDNFSEFLAQKYFGIPWNPFPSRPGLMSGINAVKNKPFSSSSSQAQEKVENEERRVKLRDAVLMTATNSKLFRFLCWFELASDIFRLFHLRKGDLVPITGMTNRVVLYKKNEDRDDRKPTWKSDQR